MEPIVEDVFEITGIDPEGKKFERVSRIKAKSQNFEMDLELDIHSELLRIRQNDRLSFVLTKALKSGKSLSEDTDSKSEMEIDTGKFDYIMNGKLFKFLDCSSNQM